MYLPKLFTLPLLAQVNKYVLAAYCRNEGGGKEGVTLRWTIWTNIPLRGEYASRCKNLVRLLLYGFSSGMSEPQGDWKKKALPPPSSPSFFTFSKNKRTSACPLQVISSPSPPHRLGNFFAFPIPWLVSY